MHMRRCDCARQTAGMYNDAVQVSASKSQCSGKVALKQLQSSALDNALVLSPSSSISLRSRVQRAASTLPPLHSDSASNSGIFLTGQHESVRGQRANPSNSILEDGIRSIKVPTSGHEPPQDKHLLPSQLTACTQRSIDQNSGSCIPNQRDQRTSCAAGRIPMASSHTSGQYNKLDGSPVRGRCAPSLASESFQTASEKLSQSVYESVNGVPDSQPGTYDLSETQMQSYRTATTEGSFTSVISTDSIIAARSPAFRLTTEYSAHVSSSRRRNSTGSLKAVGGRAIDHPGFLQPTGLQPEKWRASTGSHLTWRSRLSHIQTDAAGRRLTAQKNIWSAVGSFEPLRSSIFHRIFPRLPDELEKVCMQCIGTPDSSELRALTDIQKAAMALVAKQSVRRSAAAKDRLVKQFKLMGQPDGILDCLEQFLLTCVPILIYFDISSLTPHLEHGGYYRSHFEIPQTDATYLRKCNEREQALYSGLYEHESVRPEHHPKYGVRTTISACHNDGSSTSKFGREPLIATLNNPWHVLEAIGCDELARLAALARNPSSDIATETSRLIDCNVHGEIKLGKDVDAIVVPKSATHDKPMLSKLRSIATRHTVPLLSMEKCTRAVKNDNWRLILRHLQHETLVKKTSLGNTYGQI
ncbi:uncharacterized protein LOC34617536 [Cyclospora cayetanensis]|uniref:Uncharacterized protein LOC34617536 n=1 Tax=Cyclospora cayetanensis TaxID=88456 RepID=A0A6P6RUC0_9EIME|nr:uncharacterized protein LOC34617536 [Cyclospora cayetanensis]